MPVYPFTHHHRRHTIADFDLADDYRHAFNPNSGQPTDSDIDFNSVRELLDARALRFAAPKQYLRIVDSFHKRDRFVAQRIAWAIDLSAELRAHLADLSPSERAEFDRRTGADRD